MQTGTVRYGHLRKWLHFDGVDDYVDLGLDSRYVQNGQKELTLMWFGDIKQTYDRQSVLIGTYDNLIKLYLRDYINQGISFFLKHDDTNVWLAVPGKIGKTFIVGTYSSDEGKKKIYVDGTLSREVNDTGELQNFEAEFYIGSANIYHGGYFWGDTYFAAIYNRALSDAEISQMYDYVVNGEGEMITDGLVLWLDGDSIDIENGIWHDKSGNGNDGTIYGATYNSNWGTIKYGTIHYGV